MEYWIQHTETGTPYICGSVPPMVKLTGIKRYWLEQQFSRLKKTDVTANGYRIVKLKPIRSLRKTT